jgi:poly-gamma-glutamate synthesis protein (capsule biosynthesis protein)
LDVLDTLGIYAVGTHRTREERDTVLLKDINGITFAFLAYSYSTNGVPLTAGKPYLLNLLDENLIKSDIARAKSHNPDFIVVMPHMGDEYVYSPRRVWRDWAYLMLSAGADIVVAHHPHVLQPMEFIEIRNEDGTTRRGFVAWSLGNFISGQRTKPRDAGVILNMAFEKRGNERAYIKTISYIPTWVQFMDRSGQFNIQVLPVYETLKAYDDNGGGSIRASDIPRLRAVHAETTLMLSGAAVPAGQMQREYFLYRHDYGQLPAYALPAVLLQ